jgi:PAS domain S-box-containing protein
VFAKRNLGGLPARELPLDQIILLNEYNEVLITKLEKKAQELEITNGELLAEITERKRAEAALRASEERYRGLFEAQRRAEAHAAQVGRLLQAVVDGTSDVVFVKDRAGRYLLCNHAALRLVGKTEEQMLGQDDTALFGIDGARTIMANDRQVMESNQVYTVEEHLVTAGTARVFDSIKAPYRDEHGQVIGVVGVSRDITDQTKLEEQLRQAQKMEAVGRLAGGVAHDFNNLLTIIRSYGELILVAAEPGDTVRSNVLGIIEASERAAMLTRQLLGFSRQTLLQPKVLDLNQVVTETGRLLRRLIGENIVFKTVLAADLSRVEVDPSQLDQVLMNLAANARDAMPDGGELTIETANVRLANDGPVQSKSGAYVMLAMSDTGSGMRDEVRTRIFEPFFTTKPIGSGTGLGLPMVLGIVQQSGGCIHVDSELGHGTTFRIYLPAVEAPASIDPVRPPDAVRGTETILLVEDDDGVREVATASLELHGYKVWSAADGWEALQITQSRSESPDLVLTDVVMPHISGSELAARLRTRFPGIKVLFMSGYTEDAVLRHGLAQASVSFIQKPYTPVSLAKKVREVLDEQETVRY